MKKSILIIVALFLMMTTVFAYERPTSLEPPVISQNRHFIIMKPEIR